MDKQQAKRIIRDTFESSFDKDKFTYFIKNLLNEIEEKTFIYRGNYIPDSYSQHISTLERIGKYSDGDKIIDILIIKLKKETSLERARRMQRNFIAWYLNGSRGGQMKDAALAAFVSPGESDWRFSLVKMDYKFEKTKTGRIKVKEEFTPARRWSFLVGANEKSHTAQSRLVDILAEDEKAPILEEIEKSFDIETVTKEFFLEYRKLFIRTKEELDRVIEKDPKVKKDFEEKCVDTVNFAKKLLGQIIFLYFLQKKGWFGVGRDDNWGTGSKHFLRELFEKKHSNYKNFFNDILEPLFYEALRRDRSYDDDYYSRFNCKIPFLNGGLFDPIGNYDWVHTDINVPDQLFSNDNQTKEGDIGNGILDIFDRYNFTVQEDEPLEKEVAIDPELLGKAYEKFNAIRPDNYDEYKNALETGRRGEENKFNKKFGVYYTPREIVHYMCKQSLINYLYTKTNEAKLSLSINKTDLEDLIEVGELISEHEAMALIKEQNIKSGMQKSSEYTLLLSDSIRENARLIDEWLAEITVCDPAVGSGAFLVGMMNEIVRARNVLSVFINNDKRNNYEFKRHCIECSLYGVDIDPGAVEIAKLRLWLSLVVDEQDIRNIKPLPNLDYKIVCGNSLLGVKKDLFNKQLFDDLEELKPLFLKETNPTKKQEYKKQIDSLISKISNGHKEFDFEVYFSEVFHKNDGFDVVIGNPPYGAKFSHKLQTSLKKVYRYQSNPPESYMLFVEKGHALNRQDGIMSYIVPNTWLPSITFQKFRYFLLSKFKWLSLLVIKNKVFAAVVDTIIFILKKSKPDDDFEVPVFFFDSNGFRLAHKLLWSEIPKNGDVINIVSPPAQQRLYRKIEKKGIKVESIATVHNGVKPFEKGKGKPPQTEQIVRNKPFVIEGPKPPGTSWKPLLRGSLIRRYVSLWNNDYWIKYGEWLAAPRDPVIFEAPEKIFVRQTGDSIVATIVKSGFIARNNIHVIIPRVSTNLSFVLGVLNSKIMDFIYKIINPEKDEVLAEVKKKHVEDLLLPRVAFDEPQKQKPVIEIVDRILMIKQKNAEEDVIVLKKELDKLIYQLYGLTEDEVQIIEEST